MLGLTWAPKGKTPVLREQAGRDHLSLIAAIAPNGRIYVGGQDHSFSGEDIVWFIGNYVAATVSEICSSFGMGLQFVAEKRLKHV